MFEINWEDNKSEQDKTIYFYNVTFPNTYEHVLNFHSEILQRKYFDDTHIFTIINQSTIDNEDNLKITLPSGTTPYDFNYCRYTDVFGKDIFCFIDRYEYLNDGVINIHLTVDVYQTFLFDYSLNMCFIERQHEWNTETSGKPRLNVDTENLEIGNTYVKTFDRIIPKPQGNDIDWYLITSTSPVATVGDSSTPIVDTDNYLSSNIQGMPSPYFYYFLPVSKSGKTMFDKKGKKLMNGYGLTAIQRMPDVVSINLIPYMTFDASYSISGGNTYIDLQDGKSDNKYIKDNTETTFEFSENHKHKGDTDEVRNSVNHNVDGLIEVLTKCYNEYIKPIMRSYLNPENSWFTYQDEGKWDISFNECLNEIKAINAISEINDFCLFIKKDIEYAYYQKKIARNYEDASNLFQDSCIELHFFTKDIIQPEKIIIGQYLNSYCQHKGFYINQKRRILRGLNFSSDFEEYENYLFADYLNLDGEQWYTRFNDDKTPVCFCTTFDIYYNENTKVYDRNSGVYCGDSGLRYNTKVEDKKPETDNSLHTQIIEVSKEKIKDAIGLPDLNDEEFEQIFKGSGFSLYKISSANKVSRQIFEYNRFAEVDFEDTLRKETKLQTYPYSFYTIESGNGEPLILRPELCEDKMKIMVTTALSPTPTSRFWIDGYKNDGEGKNVSFWDKNKYDTFLVNENYLATLQSSGKSMETSRNLSLLGAFGGIAAGIATGNIVSVGSGASTGIHAITSAASKIADAETMTDSVKNFGGNTQFSINDNSDFIHLCKYELPLKMQSKIYSYFNAFGYSKRMVDYPEIYVKTHWNYLKTLGATLKTFRNIPFKYEKEIERIYDNGVTIWHYAYTEDNYFNYANENRDLYSKDW